MMDDDAFARLVAEEVKNRVTPEQREYLSLPENMDRWQRGVVTLIENLDNQLADLADREDRERERYEALGKDGLKMLAEMLADVEHRKKKVQRFRYHVERRLEAIQRLAAGSSEEIEERARLVGFLRKAIEEHQTLMIRANMEPTPIDKALWEALEGRWEFDSIDVDSLLED
jgi:hypothetical protein